MRIGVTGPIKVRPLLDHLDGRAQQYADWGEGGTQVTQLVHELVEKGYCLVVVTLDTRATSEIILSGKKLKVCIGSYRSRIRNRMTDVFRKERRCVRRTLLRESPDVVHAHWTYEYALGALATDLPTVTTIRDWAPAILGNTPPWPYRLLRLFMAMYVFWKGTHFTANSPYIASKVHRWFGWDIPVIPNALSDDQFWTGERIPSLDEPTFVSINNGFGPRKNVRTLLRAFQTVRDSLPGAQLQLFGSEYGKGEEAHDWAVCNSLTHGVDFRGKVSHQDVITAVREAEALVHPAREESFGNTLVEAMAQKTPVIAGRESGAVPWVLDYGTAGVLTDINSPKAVADAMLRLVDSEEQWRTFSEAGFQRASEEFRLSVTADRFADIYNQLIAQ